MIDIYAQSLCNFFEGESMGSGESWWRCAIDGFRLELPVFWGCSMRIFNTTYRGFV